MKQNRNEVLKKRYEVYRKLGYDSATSRALSQRSLDVSKLEISKRTGKLKQNKTTKQYIETDMKVWKKETAINTHVSKMKEIDYSDRTYSPHATRIKDKRYKGESGKIISIIKHENKLSTNQAYYFYYFMFQGNLTYKQAKKQLLTNKEFEDYEKNKHRRLDNMKEQRLNAHRKYMKK